MRSLISRFLTTGAPVLKSGIQTVAAKCFGLRKIEVIHDYGMFSVAPIGSYGLSLNVNGSEDNKSGIAYNPSLVPAVMNSAKQGESIFGNFLKGATMHFNDAGQAVITLPGDFTLSCKNANVIAAGDVNVTAVNVAATISAVTDITCPVINLNGVVTATSLIVGGSSITAAGAEFGVPTDFTAGISSNGTSIDENHGHEDVTNGPDISGGVAP